MNKSICIFGGILLIVGIILMMYSESYVIVSGHTFPADNFKNPESMSGYFTVYPYAGVGLVLVIIGFVVVVISLLITETV